MTKFYNNLGPIAISLKVAQILIHNDAEQIGINQILQHSQFNATDTNQPTITS